MQDDAEVVVIGSGQERVNIQIQPRRSPLDPAKQQVFDRVKTDARICSASLIARCKTSSLKCSSSRTTDHNTAHEAFDPDLTVAIGNRH